MEREKERGREEKEECMWVRGERGRELRREECEGREGEKGWRKIFLG